MPTGDNLKLGKDNEANHRTFITRVDKEKREQTTVFWAAAADKNSHGLRGDGIGTGAGVIANSLGSGQGLRGMSDRGIGATGESFNGGYGVFGTGNKENVGVGGSGGYAGVFGSSSWMGVYGQGIDAGTGVQASADKGAAVLAMCGKFGTAGAFFGNVQISGNLDVQGGKGAVVPFSDGTARRLYCVESPESWFEDFGEGRLVKGRARVTIDPGFAAVVRGPYHVFLAPCGDSNGLYVENQTRASFSVREQGQGKSSVRFSYRIVARRKDIPAPRLPRVKLRALPEKRSGPALPVRSGRPSRRPL